MSIAFERPFDFFHPLPEKDGIHPCNYFKEYVNSVAYDTLHLAVRVVLRQGNEVFRRWP